METATFDDGNLEQICKVLGDTDTGLTGADIGRYLHDIGLDDVSPMSTKWVRLFNSLHTSQMNIGSGSPVKLPRFDRLFSIRQELLLG